LRPRIHGAVTVLRGLTASVDCQSGDKERAAASGDGRNVVAMTAWARQQIERHRDERAEFAAACWSLADRDRGDSDVQSVEASARRAEQEAAAKLSTALKL
jgi:hypothetical protein